MIWVDPLCSGIPPVLHEVVPVATPLPPRSVTHAIWVTPTLSAAIPLRVTLVPEVENVVPDVGAVMAMVVQSYLAPCRSPSENGWRRCRTRPRRLP